MLLATYYLLLATYYLLLTIYWYAGAQTEYFSTNAPLVGKSNNSRRHTPSCTPECQRRSCVNMAGRKLSCDDAPSATRSHDPDEEGPTCQQPRPMMMMPHRVQASCSGYLLLTTYYSLLTTYYLLLTTYYLLLTTYYLIGIAPPGILQLIVWYGLLYLLVSPCS